MKMKSTIMQELLDRARSSMNALEIHRVEKNIQYEKLREESLELSRISGRLVEFEAMLNLLETAVDSKNKKRQQNSSESDSPDRGLL